MTTSPPPSAPRPGGATPAPLLRRMPARKRQLRLRRADPVLLGALRRHLVETGAAGSGGEADRLAEALVGARERIDALEAHLASAREDADAVRRRAARDRDQARAAALDEALREMIPVYDNFERALASGAAAGRSEALLEGVRMIAAQFLGVLAARGVRRLDPLGEPFDPARHDALAVAPPEPGQAEGIVVEVLRPGFLLGDRVVRPAAVRITKSA